jgi:glycosyltransferase involved in cell wall biosynthesis
MRRGFKVFHKGFIPVYNTGMEERLTIAYLVRPVEGGIKSHLATLLSGLDTGRFEPVIICPPDCALFREAREAGIRVYPVDLCGELNIVKDLKTIRHLKRLIRRIHPHVLHIHSAKAGLVGRLAVLMLPKKPKVVFTAHSFIFDERTSSIKRKVFSFVEKMLARHTDGIISVSNALKRELVDTMGVDPDKIAVIPNGISFLPPAKRNPRPKGKAVEPQAPYAVTKNGNLSLFPELEPPESLVDPSLDVPDGPVWDPIVGTVARLAPQKGIDHLVRAAAIVLLKYPTARFVIAGDGPLRRTLEDLAASMGIQESFTFLGYRTDALSIISRFDVFVLPSIRETFGITLVEALSQEVPVVASRVDGITEIVDGATTGLLAQPGDAEKTMVLRV